MYVKGSFFVSFFFKALPNTGNYPCVVGAFTNIEKQQHKQLDPEQLPVGQIQIFVPYGD